MPNRNVDKGREAENAVARVLREAGMPHAERRTKRGGTAKLPCDCRGGLPGCTFCGGSGRQVVPADAGDLTGVPGVVVQVKWSGYKPLAEDMRRTDEQRRVAGADVGLLVRKRKGVGCARADEWDAYLPQWQLAELLSIWQGPTVTPDPAARPLAERPWRADLRTAAQLLAATYS